ncbi:MAG: carboxypeptidase regulatory-like domain-containing protein [Rhodospirillales bacterium]
MCKSKWLAKIAILTLTLLVFTATPLMAQTQNISGTVVDESGAVIPGADVKITDVEKGTLARETSTDESGVFRAVNMVPGRYQIAVEKTGFKKAELTVTLNVNTRLDVGQIQLSLGQVTEVLSVSESVIPLVTTNTMEKAYLVDVKQISELPMNGRNWVALMSTVPGMTSSARNDFDVNFNDVSTFHGLGGRGSQNNFYLDGTPNLDVGDNQSQYTQPSIDSIAEFKVLQSGFNAEYGRNSGMVVAVQSKSGSSSFHGTLYEYFRNNALDAKCVLCNTLQPQLRYNQFGGNLGGWVPIPKVSSKDDKRVFFFYNREMTRRILPGSSYRDIPNANILNGDFREFLTNTKMQYAPQFYNGTVFQPGSIVRDGAGNIIDGLPFPDNTVPKNMWNPLSANLLKVYTGIPGYASLPAAPNPGYVRYYYNNPSKLRKDQDLLRIDYTVNAKLNTFFRWVNDYQEEENQNGVWAGQPFPIQPQRRPKPGSSWAWTLIGIVSPTISTETTLSYNHQSQELAVIEPNPIDRDKLGANWPQLYPKTNLTNSIPDVQASPISWNIGDPGWHNDGKDYALIENVSILKGSHSLKFGFYYNRDNKKQTATWPMNGSINFNSSSSMPLDTGLGLANLMLGNFQSYSQNNAHVYPYFRFLAYEAYAQDSWKINRRLTLEYGVRYSHMVPTFTYTRSGEPGGEGTWKLYSVDLSRYDASKRPTIDLSTGKLVGDPMTALSPLGLICDPCDGIHRGFSPAENFFAPRIGFAYDVFGDGKMALRAGFGVFHERLRQNNFNFGAGGSWPNLTSASQLNGNVSAIDLSVTQGPAPEITPPSKTIWPTDNTMPSIYSWYAGIQRELPYRLALDVSYAGNRGVHLMNQRQVNAVPAGTFIKYPNLRASVNYRDDALRPYYGWGQLTAVETLSYSSYNALMVRFSRRFANNFATNFNYTWSRVMDLVDNDGDTIINPFDMRQNWAPAGYDQTNVITWDFIYNLPTVRADAHPVVKTLLNGWEVSGIFRSQSGMPFSVSSNGSTQGVNSGSPYPDVVGDPYAGQNKHRWINPDAFRRPADGEYGNFHRNALRLPGIRNLDANLVKNFTITESVRAAFRCEVFNVFNNPQIWGIVTGFSADNPGGPISANVKNFGHPNSWREARILQLALRLSF